MGFEGVRPVSSTGSAKAERERQLALREQDPFMYDAGLAAAEGTSANGVGGDPTAILPNLIEGGGGVAVRPDVKGSRSQYYSEKDAEQIAISRARAAELARTEREINLKANSIRPGETRVGQMSDVTYAMDTANRQKWEKMRDASLEMAQKEHEAKYGLNPTTGPFGSALSAGFGGVNPFR
jgi:hypothetical protein